LEATKEEHQVPVSRGRGDKPISTGTSGKNKKNPGKKEGGRKRKFSYALGHRAQNGRKKETFGGQVKQPV